MQDKNLQDYDVHMRRNTDIPFNNTVVKDGKRNSSSRPSLFLFQTNDKGRLAPPTCHKIQYSQAY